MKRVLTNRNCKVILEWYKRGYECFNAIFTNVKYVLIVLILFGKTSWCQNLVPNPSFEVDLFNCCDPFSGVICTTDWIYFGQSPDYFNVCLSNSIGLLLSVPQNMAGYQQASGDGYYGLFTKAMGQSFPNYREMVGTALLVPLTVGQSYHVSMKVALADSCNCATNNVGFHFSMAPYENDSFPMLVPNYAQVYAPNIITDTNWTIIFGSFLADLPYQYLSLGNFFDDASTDTVVYTGRPFSAIYNWAHPDKCFSYYYIDDVCVSSDSLDCELSTWLHQPVQSYFSIYPNPSHQAVNLTLPQDATLIEIFNAVGQSVYKRSVTTSHQAPSTSSIQAVDVSNFSEGIYFVRVHSHQGVQTKKLLVQR